MAGHAGENREVIGSSRQRPEPTPQIVGVAVGRAAEGVISGFVERVGVGAGEDRRPAGARVVNHNIARLVNRVCAAVIDPHVGAVVDAERLPPAGIRTHGLIESEAGVGTFRRAAGSGVVTRDGDDRPERAVDAVRAIVDAVRAEIPVVRTAHAQVIRRNHDVMEGGGIAIIPPAHHRLVAAVRIAIGAETEEFTRRQRTTCALQSIRQAVPGSVDAASTGQASGNTGASSVAVVGISPEISA